MNWKETLKWIAAGLLGASGYGAVAVALGLDTAVGPEWLVGLAGLLGIIMRKLPDKNDNGRADLLDVASDRLHDVNETLGDAFDLAAKLLDGDTESNRAKLEAARSTVLEARRQRMRKMEPRQ